MYNKKNIVIAVIVVLVIIVVGFLIYKGNQNKGYSIVYLTTREVYIGKLATFPDFQLKDSYILQVIKDEKDPTKNNFQLQPTKEALWSPQVLHLVKDNVVFYGPLMSDSSIAKTLAGQPK
ncbi:TPA: hypothetical protein DEQ22_02085 [Candidatus Nomurabacteria bacterium]|uniref:Uncharacterized protein n=2 Tax=Candidatus Nomuraibacteriota TaxID=1752729 RepID=A0A1F6YPQ1_9BACT|nr:MAG: hypothetical protein UV13_C0004G0011 [Parcubacteria group bacterium GW2011_GWC1_42_21]KKS58029.1 MAG: hypothetical protein UV23_C0018G0012 [Candidatus Nomurabacteria bacterium GW2011_GWF1_42_40]KKT00465.1 MAG: hypothetical protein UV77_C0003G0011 [Candidatus Nomurabacteria bacterium GW2011_GWA1_43_17]KKT07812.1 MAG: hypothetical protein UV85_C0004G0012 [Candidatus Nomurabacteria bacterium GW2011_GWB1_43_19]KKT11382.1 MAG: hypothetical protein UV91_C0006G0011 [Candidatus Nomurabacteria b